MGKIFYKTPSGWVEGHPAIKVGTGWKYGVAGFRKTGESTWTQFYTRDTSPPQAPVVTLEQRGSTGRFNVFVTRPPGDTQTYRRVVVTIDYDRRGISPITYPTGDNPTPTGYRSGLDENGQIWSEWTPGTPGQTKTKIWPPLNEPELTQAGSLLNKYRVNAWAQDDFFNWSSIGSDNDSLIWPDANPTGMVAKQAYVNVIQSRQRLFLPSATWDLTQQALITQGGTRAGYGLWYYGTQLRDLLRNASKITKMQIYIQRAPGWGPAVATPTLVAHTYPVWIESGTTATGTVTQLPALTAGQGAWNNVPSGWWNNFISGAWRGLGLWPGGATTDQDPRHMVAWGYGTSSGRLLIEWEEPRG